MFYLFNRTYLEFSVNLNNANNGIVLHSEFGKYPFAVTKGKIYHANTSYSKLIEHQFANDENKFFEFILSIPSNENFTIYAELEDFSTILVKFLKTILPKAQTHELFILYRLHLLKFKTIHSQKVDYSDESKNQYFTLPILNESEFIQKYSSVFPYKVKDPAFKNNVGVEYLLATYLANKHTNYAKEFESRVKKICWKNFAWELHEIKQCLLSSMFDFDKMFPNITNIDFTTTTFEDIVNQDSRFDFITDMDCSVQNTSAYYKTYDSKKIADVWAAYWLKMGTETFMTKFFDLMVNDPVNVDVEKIISLDIDQNFGTQIFARAEYQDKMNPLIVSYLYSLNRQNDIDTLKRLSL